MNKLCVIYVNVKLKRMNLKFEKKSHKTIVTYTVLRIPLVIVIRKRNRYDIDMQTFC